MAYEPSRKHNIRQWQSVHSELDGSTAKYDEWEVERCINWVKLKGRRRAVPPTSKQHAVNRNEKPQKHVSHSSFWKRLFRFECCAVHRFLSVTPFTSRAKNCQSPQQKRRFCLPAVWVRPERALNSWLTRNIKTVYIHHDRVTHGMTSLDARMWAPLRNVNNNYCMQIASSTLRGSPIILNSRGARTMRSRQIDKTSNENARKLTITASSPPPLPSSRKTYITVNYYYCTQVICVLALTHMPFRFISIRLRALLN